MIDAGTISAPCGWEEDPTNPGFMRMRECGVYGSTNITELLTSGWSGLDIPGFGGSVQTPKRGVHPAFVLVTLIGLVLVVR
jgi:hypothetical protein